jgi:hypothetical protein
MDDHTLTEDNAFKSCGTFKTTPTTIVLIWVIVNTFEELSSEITCQNESV